MPKPEIVLSHGTEFVLVQDIARLIIKALHPVEFPAWEARIDGCDAAREAWRKQLAPEDRGNYFPVNEREKFYDANDGELTTYRFECYFDIAQDVQRGALEARNQGTRNVTTNYEMNVIVMLEELIRYVKPRGISVRLEDAPVGAEAAKVKDGQAGAPAAEDKAGTVAVPVGEVPASKTANNKGVKALAYNAEVHHLMTYFWNNRLAGTSPTKGNLHKTVYEKMLHGNIKPTYAIHSISTVQEAAKPWRKAEVVPSHEPPAKPPYVPPAKTGETRHPFKGDR